jgi:glycolate oxidase FAD binding subunit
MLLSPETLLQESGLSGRADAREPRESDAVDGVAPRVVVEPESAETLALLLAWASRESLSVVLRGRGTKLGWGRRPAAIDLLVGTRRLDRVLGHQHGDLTASVEAGATIADLNRELARHGQWLPVDPSFDDATVGGTIAANDSGPLRHRHGTARDLLIGVHLAMTDGRLVKAGGNVVKNVAGYDLGKLMSGSCGTLAAIVGATFKLAPLPASSATMLAGFREPAALARAVAAVSASQLEPAAFDVHVFIPSRSVGTAGRAPEPAASGSATPASGVSQAPAYQLLVQFASTAEAVQAQMGEARRLLDADQYAVSGFSRTGDAVSGSSEAAAGTLDQTDAWRGHRDLVWAPPGAVIRLSWMPASLPSVLTLVDDIGRSGARSVALAGRASVGAGFVRVDAEPSIQVNAIELLRASAIVGNVVVVRAAAEVKARADVWGSPGDTAALLRAVKRAFDPVGILNAGRGPV